MNARQITGETLHAVDKMALPLNRHIEVLDEISENLRKRRDAIAMELNTSRRRSSEGLNEAAVSGSFSSCDRCGGVGYEYTADSFRGNGGYTQRRVSCPSCRGKVYG